MNTKKKTEAVEKYLALQFHTEDALLSALESDENNYTSKEIIEIADEIKTKQKLPSGGNDSGQIETRIQDAVEKYNARKELNAELLLAALQADENKYSTKEIRLIMSRVHERQFLQTSKSSVEQNINDRNSRFKDVLSLIDYRDLSSDIIVAKTADEKLEFTRLTFGGDKAPSGKVIISKKFLDYQRIVRGVNPTMGAYDPTPGSSHNFHFEKHIALPVYAKLYPDTPYNDVAFVGIRLVEHPIQMTSLKQRSVIDVRTAWELNGQITNSFSKQGQSGFFWLLEHPIKEYKMFDSVNGSLSQISTQAQRINSY